MIKAEAHSDDRVFEVGFDATLWFEQANDQAIIDLAECEWGGDYPADAVAMYMADKDQAVERIFKYIELMGDRQAPESIGFECHVDEQDALWWLTKHRPALIQMVQDALDKLERGGGYDQ